MSQAYKIHKQDAAYFITLQVVHWIDLFTRKRYRNILTDSMNFCIHQKGLTVYCYVIMSNHVHLICSADRKDLSKILKEMKTFTSRKIIESIMREPESRREWLLKMMSEAADRHSRNSHYQLWTHENHAIECFSPKFTFQRIRYTHLNPVRAGIVDKEEDYLYSSARDYIGIKGLVDVSVIHPHLAFH